MKTNQQSLDKFNFFIPLELEKGTEENGGLVKISGVASTDAKDDDGETLIPAGFDFAPLLQSGFLNWNHQARTTSKAICGEPTSAKIINNGKDFFIEGVIYPNAEGKNVIELAETLEKHSPNRRLGFSIEGQAIERDIFNPKKVLRAKITGVAITQCPKNPNTLMNIIKGEYDNDFDKEEEEEVEAKEGAEEKPLDKAMTVNIDINPESVEGADKKKELSNELKKSEIYNQIYKRYTNSFEKADQIYNFINKVNEKSMNTNNITPETLEKAYNLLDQSLDLQKGDDQKSLEDDDKNDEDSKKDEDIKKSEDDDSDKDLDKSADADEDDEDFEKAMNCEGIAKSFLDKGMSKDEVVKAMTSVGISTTLAETSCSNCIAQANAEKDGGHIEALSKSNENEFEKEESNALMTQMLDKKFSALGFILKSQSEQIDNLIKSNTEVQKEFRDFKNQPEGRKSVTTVKALERFEKSADGTSTEVYDSRNAADMNLLGDRLFKEYQMIKSNGGEDRGLEKAVSDLEISKTTNFAAISPRLRQLGIQVQ